jgi:hypothetical protein
MPDYYNPIPTYSYSLIRETIITGRWFNIVPIKSEDIKFDYPTVKDLRESNIGFLNIDKFKQCNSIPYLNLGHLKWDRQKCQVSETCDDLILKLKKEDLKKIKEWIKDETKTVTEAYQYFNIEHSVFYLENRVDDYERRYSYHCKFKDISFQKDSIQLKVYRAIIAKK